MNPNITFQLNDRIETIIIPVAGSSAAELILSNIKGMTHTPPKLVLQDFKGEKGNVHFLYSDQKRIILVGLGENPTFNTIIRTFRKLVYKTRKKLAPPVALSFEYGPVVPEWESMLEGIVNGLVLGNYNIGHFKTDQDVKPPISEDQAVIDIVVPSAWGEIAQKCADHGRMVGETQMRIMELVNAPSNKKTAGDLAQWALASGEKFGYQVKVLDKKQIIKTGLNALLAVNQGSTEPPAFIIMEYNGAPKGQKDTRKIGFVGKGVTFDTGGLSLKPSSNMHFMKSDMGGAGAVFGTMELSARLQLPIHLIGIVPATDNSIGSNAIKPSDIIHSYSGKTIEVIDTDAEGRLILADGLAYMIKHYQPDVLIDLATLTGSTVRTFGYHTGGLFTNNDQLADQLESLGAKSGERLWRLPIWEEYLDDMKSDVADIKNFSGRPIAGAITAAKFLEFFTDKHPCWAHMDIAGVAFGDTEFSLQKSATAYGVRLLNEFIKAEIEKTILETV